MFKNLLIAVLVAIILTWCFGELFTDSHHMQIMFDDGPANFLEGGLAITGIVIFFVVLGFLLAVSMLSVLFFVGIVVVGSILFAGVAALWPAILFVAIVIWLVKDNKQPNY
ncbi:hypothetical protein [Neptunicella marina]|uniref:Uncharacterized protein n=1 Tax=Neptunicella marina TaxID=2125989 RepID=A0A8J6IYD5_9ALTE|nr:hypothetical protein [Neptunicella marina]MBC3767537.1 hypothetical protein [Neptunicella marina]